MYILSLTELFDDAKGPIPTDRYMFEGMVFLLTHVDKTLEQKREERNLLIESSFEGSTDESAIEGEHVRIIIQAQSYTYSRE